jgi:hypothetical protein
MPPYLFNERDEKLMLQYLLLTRQITSLADSVQHIIRLGNKPRNETNILKYKGYVAFIQSELSDVYAQYVKLCDLLELDVKETNEMGMKRQLEKMEEYLKKNPEDVWI